MTDMTPKVRQRAIRIHLTVELRRGATFKPARVKNPAAKNPLKKQAAQFFP